MYDLDTDKWYSRSCFQEFRFLCIIDNLVLVTENKTWEEALEHCRNMTTPCAASGGCMYRHDLLSLQWSDHSYVSDRIYKATSDEVWKWVDTCLHIFTKMILKGIKLLKKKDSIRCWLVTHNFTYQFLSYFLTSHLKPIMEITEINGIFHFNNIWII